MNDLDKNTEALLTGAMVTAPDDFRDAVMQRVAAHERELQQELMAIEKAGLQPVPWWQWMALTVGSLIGVGQVLRFIFSVWFVTAAG